MSRLTDLVWCDNIKIIKIYSNKMDEKYEKGYKYNINGINDVSYKFCFIWLSEQYETKSS